MNVKYPCIIKRQEDSRYLVLFPDLEEALTEGESLEEALFNATEVLTLTLEGRFDEKIEIPYPSTGKYEYWIAPSAQVQAALLIRFVKKDVKTSDLARSLETSWPAAAKLENPHHWPTLKQLDKAAKALGKRLIISLEETSKGELRPPS